MAPVLKHLFERRNFDLNSPSVAFRADWTSPSNYAFTILLLLGGDVVSRALAQLVGGWITPVAFSFGWVSYATSAVNSAVGENRLMPGPDTPCNVINVSSGQSRGNGSWILGRMIRDFEYWMGPHVEKKVEEVRWQKTHQGQDLSEMKDPIPESILARFGRKLWENIDESKDAVHAGLVVSFWKVDSTKASSLGKPGRDILFWSGIVVSILQLGVAAIPFGIYGNWGIFLITAAAIVLCLLTGAQKQWRREKWACRKIAPNKKRNYILTRGNGAQHAIVIQCDGVGLDLEDLCTGFDNLDSPSISIMTRLVMVALGAMWVILLITSSALTDQAWFLIAVGGMGMLQNMFVAGWAREPEALGIPLKYDGVVGHPRVSETVLEVEKRLPKAGRALVGVFFPVGLWEKDEAALQAIERNAAEKAKET